MTILEVSARFSQVKDYLRKNLPTVVEDEAITQATWKVLGCMAMHFDSLQERWQEYADLLLNGYELARGLMLTEADPDTPY